MGSLLNLGQTKRYHGVMSPVLTKRIENTFFLFNKPTKNVILSMDSWIFYKASDFKPMAKYYELVHIDFRRSARNIVNI